MCYGDTEKGMDFSMLLVTFSELKLSSVRIMISLGGFCSVPGQSHLIRFFLVSVLLQLVKRWKVGVLCWKKLGVTVVDLI